ncbi:MAG: methyl-accepting chemotaxis protein [Treponema sp.]|jgi:PAS domain S-box-containing protein|nr:methyl-accepting chemotaxis protein [Treponema sp.]
MFRKNKKLTNQNENLGLEILLSESKRLLAESDSRHMSIIMPTPSKSKNIEPEIIKILENLSKAIQNNQENLRYDIMKYQLGNKALNTGMWDMDVVAGDPANPNNKFTWSDHFRRMLGFKDENDFPNLTSSWVDRLHPEDKEYTLDSFVKHLTDHSGKTPYNLEYRCKLKSGEYRWYQAIGETVRDGKGLPLRVAGLFLDIHERKMAEETERQLREQLKHASGLIEGIDRKIQELNKAIDKEVTLVNETAAVTVKIINSLQHTSNVSRKEEETIKRLIETAARGKEAMLGTIQSVNSTSESVGGIADTIQIIRAIASNTNLLAMNAAIEAAHAGESGRGFAVVADEIRKLADSTGKNSKDISITLKTIIDGMAFTTKQTGNTDSCINEISTEVNGFAETISEFSSTLNDLADESSEITNALNNLQDQSKTIKTGYEEILSMTEKLSTVMLEYTRNIEESKLEADKHKDAAGSKMKQILLIDDDQVHLDSAKAMLENDFDLVLMKSGKAALDLLFHGLVPNLILLDLVMPGMDGWDTFSRIRTISGVHKIPIAFFSSSNSANDKDQAREMGAVDFIIKPCKKIELIARIKRIII